MPIEGSNWNSVFIVADKPVPERAQLPSSAFIPVSAGYFQTMGIRLARGRTFTERDGPGTPFVTVINQTFARRFWPNEDPIGKRIKQGWPESKTPWREVVGVVADIKLNGVIDETPNHVYIPLEQSSDWRFFLAVRTTTEPQTLSAAVQSAVHAVDSQIPLYSVRTMEDRLELAVVSQRAAMILLSA